MAGGALFSNRFPGHTNCIGISLYAEGNSRQCFNSVVHVSQQPVFMVLQMIGDSFSIDIYCHYLDLPTEGTVDSERNPVMSLPRTEQRSIRSHRNWGQILSRLMWLFIGPIVLMILSILKLETHSSELTALDAGFAATIVSIILFRCLTFFAGDRCDSFSGRMRVSGLAVFAGLTSFMAGGVWMLLCLLVSQ